MRFVTLSWVGLLVIFIVGVVLCAIGKHSPYGAGEVEPEVQRSRTSEEMDAASASGHATLLTDTGGASPDYRVDPHSTTANVVGALIPVTADGQSGMAVFRYDSTFAQYDYAGVIDLAPGEQIRGDAILARENTLYAFLRTPSEHEMFVQYLRSGGIFTITLALMALLGLYVAWFTHRGLVMLIPEAIDSLRPRVRAWRKRLAARKETAPAAADFSAMSLTDLEAYTESRYDAAIDDFSRLIAALKNRFAQEDHP